jgi:imidazolonepropionase-like amidohydrolase
MVRMGGRLPVRAARVVLGAACLLAAGCSLHAPGVPATAPPAAARETAEAAPALPPSAPVEPVPAEPSGPATLLVGATVMSAAGPTLPEADVLIRGSKIEAVAAYVEPPRDARVVDVSGRFVTPGLIDPHSHLGVFPVPRATAHADGNEMSQPFTPDVRAEESFWPQDPAIRRAVAGGVTTVQILPGSANLVGGQGVTLRLRPALSAREMRFPGAPTTMKMACGENPKRVYGQRRKAPTTRMGEVALLRQALEDARSYEEKRESKQTERLDYGNEALLGVLRGEIPIHNHCYRADEMLLRLDLFAEFDLAPRAFHHAVEAYKIRDRLAAAGVGAVVWSDWWGFKMEALDGVPAGAALLDVAGVRVALHSDSERDVQRLNQEAARALAAGRRAGIPVDRDRALRWITANPAWVLGIDDRVGTLEPGKEADVVVWSGDPFSIYTRADLVFSAGELVYDRNSPGLYPSSDFELGIREAP